MRKKTVNKFFNDLLVMKMIYLWTRVTKSAADNIRKNQWENGKHCKAQGMDKEVGRKSMDQFCTFCNHTILDFSGYKSLCLYW